MNVLYGKKLEAKRQHHYVQADYLRNWDKHRKNIWHNTKTGKVINAPTKSVAQERDFYRLRYISKDQINLIRLFIGGFTDFAKYSFEEILKSVLMIQNLDIMRELAPQDDYLDKSINALKSNFIEDDHGYQERQAKPIIDSIIRNREHSILEDDNNILKLSTYIGHQITRTRAYRDAWIKYLLTAKDMMPGVFNANLKNINDIDDCWWLVSHITGLNVGWNLYSISSDNNQCLMINGTSQPFITSDSPVINVYPRNFDDSGNIQGHESDIFLPLSPNVAYISSGSKLFPNDSSVCTDAAVIDEINVKIASQANNIIIGCRPEDVQRYMRFINKR